MDEKPGRFSEEWGIFLYSLKSLPGELLDFIRFIWRGW